MDRQPPDSRLGDSIHTSDSGWGLFNKKYQNDLDRTLSTLSVEEICRQTGCTKGAAQAAKDSAIKRRAGH